MVSFIWRNNKGNMDIIWWQLILDEVVFGLLIIGGVAFVVHRAMITEAVGQETPSKACRFGFGPVRPL